MAQDLAAALPQALDVRPPKPASRPAAVDAWRPGAIHQPGQRPPAAGGAVRVAARGLLAALTRHPAGWRRSSTRPTPGRCDAAQLRAPEACAELQPQISDRALHDASAPQQLQLFCAQTLRTKVEHDFEELPAGAARL